MVTAASRPAMVLGVGVLLAAAFHCAAACSLQWRVRESTLGCATAEDCSLNGKCDAGKCVCSSACRGASCEMLRLKDGTPSALGFHGAEHSTKEGAGASMLSLSSWGGSVHRGKNGAYHLIASEIGHGVLE